MKTRGFGGCVAASLVVASGCAELEPSAADPDAPRLPTAVQKQLPVELHLANLCPSAETPPRLQRDLRRQARVLLRELDERPHWRLTYTFYYEEGDETKEITVRDLAEEELEHLKSNDEGEQELTGQRGEPDRIRARERARTRRRQVAARSHRR